MRFNKKSIRGWGACMAVLALLAINAWANSDSIVRIKTCSVSIAAYYPKTEAASDIQNMRSFEKYPVILVEESNFRVIIGSGTLLDGEYILTAGHIVTYTEEGPVAIFVFFQNRQEFLKASIIVAINEGPYDYAVLKLSIPVHVKGIKIAKVEPTEGESVAWIGTPKRNVFFLRFGTLHSMMHYFVVENGTLVLKEFSPPFWTVFPGESGDSGGGIFNSRGELLSIIYLKRPLDGQTWVLANPNSYLWKFLKDNSLIKQEK